MLKRIYHKFQSNDLLKTGSYYSLSSTVNSFAKMFVGIVIMRWLNPYELGLWNAVSIFLAYIPFFQLGIQNGLSIELPILMGNSDPDYKKYIASARWYSYFISIFFMVGGLIATVASLFFADSFELTLGIGTICIIAASTSLTLHLISTFRTSKSFDKLTKIYIIESITTLLATYFVYQYHYYGILLFNILIVVQHTVLLYIYSPYKDIKPEYSKTFLQKLLKRGMVIMLFYQLRVLAQSFPRWIILALGGVLQLGLFSPAMALKTMMNLLPSQINQFLQPQMGFKYGKDGKASLLWPHIYKMIWIYPLICLPVTIGVVLFMPYVVTTFFPKYTASILSIQIMSVAFIFSSYATTHNILYTLKAYKEAYIFLFFELLGYAAFPFLCYFTLDTDVLSSISVGILINYVFLYLFNYFLLKKVLFADKYNTKIT
ncbi:MAG: lipopolysaccharide biosynthesis protein [Flavobacterium sp.]